MKFILATMLAASSLMAFAAMEQPTGQAGGQQLQGQQQAEVEQIPNNINGTIVAFHTTRIKGDEQRHAMLAVKTDQGHFVGVDLGPVNQLQASENLIAWHQPVSIQGQQGKINGRPILVAQQLKISDKMIPLAPPKLLDEQSAFPAAFGRALGQGLALETGAQQTAVESGQQLVPKSISGTIVGTREVDIQGENAPHLLAKIRTEDGATAAIDLGVKQNVPALKLDQGQFLTATGVVGELNDRPVLIADHAGNLQTLQRPETMGQQPAGAQPMKMNTVPGAK